MPGIYEGRNVPPYLREAKRKRGEICEYLNEYLLMIYCQTRCDFFCSSSEENNS